MPPFASPDEQFRLLMEEVTDYAIFADPDRRIVTWNVGAERILGWTEDEIIGQEARIIFTPEDRAKGDPEREIGLAEVEGRAVKERCHVRKDESRFWVSRFVTALRNEAGELRGFCEIMRDLTERKQWEEDLQAAHY